MDKLFFYTEIVLFSTGCPKCSVLKTKLDKAGLEYTEENDVNRMLSLGIKEVPVLSVDGVLFNFKEANEWLNNFNK